MKKQTSEGKMHCTSFTGILVVDCIIEVDRISVHKLPINRQRNAQSAQQQRKCRRNCHYPTEMKLSVRYYRKKKEKKKNRGVSCSTAAVGFYKHSTVFLTSPCCSSYSLTYRTESRAHRVHSKAHIHAPERCFPSPAVTWVTHIYVRCNLSIKACSLSLSLSVLMYWLNPG